MQFLGVGTVVGRAFFDACEREATTPGSEVF